MAPGSPDLLSAIGTGFPDDAPERRDPPVWNPRVWAEIDLDAIARNLARVRERAGPITRVLAVLKADAYGHGAIPIARRLVAEGIDMIGVGDSSEAIELRRAGLADVPILILGAVVPAEAGLVVEHDISVCVHSFDRLRLLRETASALGRTVRVHLKVDTGMGRLGVAPPVATEMAREILAEGSVTLDGVCTHLSSTDHPDPSFTRRQLEQFRGVLAELDALGIRPEYVHAANSAALMNGVAGGGGIDPRFDLVRVGVALYGFDPGGMAGADELEPALSLRTQVVFLKDHPEGAPIGYGRTYVTDRPTRIATLPIGYNDGYPFALGNRATAIVRGRPVPVVGRISMDYTTIDVGDVPGVSVGDVATLIGRDGDERIRLEELAELAGTIPYEIPCRLGRRVWRIPVSPDGIVPAGPEPARIAAEPCCPNSAVSGVAAESSDS